MVYSITMTSPSPYQKYHHPPGSPALPVDGTLAKPRCSMGRTVYLPTWKPIDLSQIYWWIFQSHGAYGKDHPQPRGHTEPQPLLDLAAAKAMNSARIPQGVASSKRRYVGSSLCKPGKTVQTMDWVSGVVETGRVFSWGELKFEYLKMEV